MLKQVTYSVRVLVAAVLISTVIVVVSEAIGLNLLSLAE
jgi:hypothetical protein